MDSSDPQSAAFLGYDLSASSSPSKHHRGGRENGSDIAQKDLTQSSQHFNDSSSDHDSWFSYPSRHTLPENAAMAAPFEVSKLWREAMQCVSINAGLYPKQILQKYYNLYPSQASIHPGYIELDIWRSKRATVRGTKYVHIRYLDNDPGKIYLMVIFVDEVDPNTNKPIVRLVTNTSIRHVLEEPCANCPLWLKVHSDAGPHANSPYQIIPCCDKWVESADFEAPISSEEKQVPEMVAKLIEEVQRKALLLHAKEREIEAKDDQLRRLREMKDHSSDAHVTDAAVAQPRHLLPTYKVEFGTPEQYCWATAVLAIFLMLWLLK
ncbi:hypothetical protein J7T55_014240 [Diaporthe amygdali]|uniref:uncharacterized protein n=1 Tax=Phomopsis amygdali TaxID=1214568 RepID=UPI0022FDDA0A|nr:uncharacterized protein J7T55_014240 [Diaporthe amygdali]KAJ0109678.1 hypothetical protein J7T55_014240 [Diaporthe amygdali]